MVHTSARSLEAQEVKAECFESSACDCAVVGTKGRRKEHEDACAVSCSASGADLWVLDGHRGGEASAFGADQIPKEIGHNIKDGRLPSNGRIQQCFRTIDNRLRKFLKEKAKDTVSGSTVIGALVARQDDGMYSAKVINCGDSRGIIIEDPCADENGKSAIVLQTVDHKPDSPKEKARVQAAGGTVTKGRCPRIDGKLAVSRGLGDFDFKADKGRQAAQQKVSCEPDVYEVSGLKPGALLLLACDGIWNVMSSETVAEMVHEALAASPKASLGDIAYSIVKESYGRGSCDNLTVLLARLAGKAGAEAASMHTADAAAEASKGGAGDICPTPPSPSTEAEAEVE
mmetsp:Transcript_28139/g.80882  ORF Transcript_28139/g.80882 Transcript_28139/m.80882 type:complete len:343 (+) Transcript_28139:103-1131(+)